jgi:hypothetical protein
MTSRVEAELVGRMIHAAVGSIKGTAATRDQLVVIIEPRGVAKLRKIMARAAFEEVQRA